MKTNANATSMVAVAAIVSAFGTGCAVQADDGRAPDGTFDNVDDTVATKGPPPGCAAVIAMAVDATVAGGSTVNVADPCDYWVVEKTLADDNYKIEVSMTQTLATQGITVPGASPCTASYIVSEAWGKRAPYYTTGRDGTPIFHAGGNWELLGEKTIYGKWSGSGVCNFPDAQLYCGIGSPTVSCKIPIFNDPSGYYYKPYSMVRVAMKNRVYGTTGVVSASPKVSFAQIP